MTWISHFALQLALLSPKVEKLLHFALQLALLSPKVEKLSHFALQLALLSPKVEKLKLGVEKGQLYLETKPHNGEYLPVGYRKEQGRGLCCYHLGSATKAS
mmetsp:Transcript_33113/g.53156  ORF Transcript_33113/g.53156 Transcript_33113/m.53156 type:complete len:101 (-) Transcript_33113:1410-1712(-)